MLHVVTCPIIFILFDDPDWQRGMLKLMKTDHFLVFLAVWVLFLKFLYVRTSQNDMSVTFSCVPNCFYFVL